MRQLLLKPTYSKPTLIIGWRLQANQAVKFAWPQAIACGPSKSLHLLGPSNLQPNLGSLAATCYTLPLNTCEGSEMTTNRARISVVPEAHQLRCLNLFARSCRDERLH